MTFEVAIATMHKTKEECLKMLDDENIHCDCIVVNQCDIEDYAEENVGNQHVRIFFTKERGLSKSRNMAIRNMKADVLAIGDDDLHYYDGFDKTILAYYEQNPKADVVLFNFDDCYKIYPNKSKKCFFFELSGYKSMQTTFRSNLHGNKPIQTIPFNEYFGTGSQYAQFGEENIFFADVWRAGARIYYCKDKIVKREKTESSWFKGYTEKYIKDAGAIYFAFSPFFWGLYSVRFILKRLKGMRPITFIHALHLVCKGKSEYQQYLRETVNEVTYD